MANKKNNSKYLGHRKFVKHAIKFLACNPHYSIQRRIIKDSPVKLIKAISNAALNVREGDIELTPIQKAVFSEHHKLFYILTDKKHPIESKRKHLVNQKGGAIALLAPILSSALIGLGSAFMNSLFDQKKY